MRLKLTEEQVKIIQNCMTKEQIEAFYNKDLRRDSNDDPEVM